MADHVQRAGWSDEKKVEQFKLEVRARFEAENAGWRTMEEREIAQIRARDPNALALKHLETRDSFFKDIFDRIVFTSRANSVKAILPTGFAIYDDFVKMFDGTSVAWSRADIGAEIIDGEAHVVIDVLLIDEWDDARHEAWLAAHPPRDGTHLRDIFGPAQPWADPLPEGTTIGTFPPQFVAFSIGYDKERLLLLDEADTFIELLKMAVMKVRNAG